ncbi:acetyltransferase [Priestia flexa]|uniref:acetyltransferase n=1 Tax=Priestia flexa TaxID=86664 RepID=UPI00095674D3|nr:acetyltransferase [Priestia flexa]SIQ25261.1 sugar O-acyltransferase, sialic acid O-acetyltransferase NeuD family [Priestia flexa]
MAKLLILGAGGHGKVVSEISQLMKQWEEIAFLDDREDISEVLGIPIVGKLADLPVLRSEYEYAFVAIGSNTARLKWTEKLNHHGFKIPILIHPSSTVSTKSSIEQGTVIMAGAVINPDARIGRGCIINTASTIDHDCILQAGVHTSPGTHIGGTVKIGERTWICIGATIINNIDIGYDSVIAAGAVVTRDVPSNVLVAGVPAVIKG